MYVLILAAVLFLGAVFLMQYLTIRRARRNVGRPAPDTAAVDGAAHGDPRRLYYFHSPQCGPCRAMTPMVDKLGAEHRNLVKVDVTQAPELARAFGILATPSFVLVEDGEIREVKLGGQSERQIRAMLGVA